MAICQYILLMHNLELGSAKINSTFTSFSREKTKQEPCHHSRSSYSYAALNVVLFTNDVFGADHEFCTIDCFYCGSPHICSKELLMVGLCICLRSKSKKEKKLSLCSLQSLTLKSKKLLWVKRWKSSSCCIPIRQTASSGPNQSWSWPSTCWSPTVWCFTRSSCSACAPCRRPTCMGSTDRSTGTMAPTISRRQRWEDNMITPSSWTRSVWRTLVPGRTALPTSLQLHSFTNKEKFKEDKNQGVWN